MARSAAVPAPGAAVDRAAAYDTARLFLVSALALTTAGIRAEGNFGSEKIGAKIRTATLQKVPYMLVLGEQEQAAGKVAVRHRTDGDKGQMSLEEFVQRAEQEIATRRAEIERARAQVAVVDAQLADTIAVSPVGEMPTARTAFLSGHVVIG